jgi:hypothetical protein
MTNRTWLVYLLLCCCAWAVPGWAQEARLQFDQLNYLGSRAKETIEVTMDRPAVQLVAKLTALDGKEHNRFRELAARLQGIYIRSYEFEREGEYSLGDVESLRAQLRSPLWQRLVQVRERNGESNEVYFVARNDQMEGVAVITVEPRRLCVANLVGQLDLNDLGLLDREFGITSCGKNRLRREVRTR